MWTYRDSDNYVVGGELYHYGVKGMRWRHHKGVTSGYVPNPDDLSSDDWELQSLDEIREQEEKQKREEARRKEERKKKIRNFINGLLKKNKKRKRPSARKKKVTGSSYISKW